MPHLPDSLGVILDDGRWVCLHVDARGEICIEFIRLAKPTDMLGPGRATAVPREIRVRESDGADMVALPLPVSEEALEALLLLIQEYRKERHGPALPELELVPLPGNCR